MLLVDSRLEVGSVSLFRDHVAADLFHHLPGVPRLRPGGLGLLLYRGPDGSSAGSGGLLTLDVELAHEAGALDDVRTELRRRFGVEPQLVPVLFDRGVVRLTTLGVGQPPGPGAAPSSGAVGGSAGGGSAGAGSAGAGPSGAGPLGAGPSGAGPLGAGPSGAGLSGAGPSGPGLNPDLGGPVSSSDGTPGAGPHIGAIPTPHPGANPTPLPGAGPTPDHPAAAPSTTGGAPSRAGLVERILGTATPALLGGGRAIFSVSLDREGAVALQAALAAGQFPATVVYELGFRGLQPASGFRAELDSTMAYDHLRSRAAANTLWLKADIDREAESLERTGAIRIVDVDYLGSDPQLLADRRAAALELLHEVVAMTYYRPATAPSSGPSGVAGAVPAGGPGAVPAAAGGVPAGPAGAARVVGGVLGGGAFVLRELHQDEQQSTVYDRSEIGVVERAVAPQGAVLLPDGFDSATVVREVDLVGEDEPFAVTLAAVDGADWTGVSAIRIDLRSEDGVRTAVLNPTTPSATIVVPAGPVEYRLVASCDPLPADLGEPHVRLGEFAPLDGTSMIVDPATVAGRSVLTVVLGSVVDQDTEVTVDLTAGVDRRTLLLGAGRPSAEQVTWGDPEIGMSADFRTTDGSFRSEGAVPVGERCLAVNLPRDRIATVLAVAQDPLARYVSVDVELDTGEGTRRTRLSLDGAHPSASWTRVRAAGDDGSYRYRVTVARRDGVPAGSDWTVGAGGQLVVGDADVRLHRITLVLAGWTDLAGALLTLTTADPAPGVPAKVEALLSPVAGSSDARADVLLATRREAPLRYRLTGQVFLADRVVELDLADRADEVLILGWDPLESTCRHASLSIL